MFRSIFQTHRAPPPPPPRPPLLRPPALRPVQRPSAPPRPLRTRATPAAEFLVSQSAIIGQGIVYFTLFYTTANWWYYRRAREDAERADKNRKNK
jgi:hypothetical protein